MILGKVVEEEEEEEPRKVGVPAQEARPA